MKIRTKVYKILILLLALVMAFGVSPVSAAAKKVKVSTQKKLVSEMKKAKAETIVFATQKAKTVTIPKVSTGSNKRLIIDAPKATIVNKSGFKSITINSAKGFTEKGKGNTITLNDPNTKVTIYSNIKTKKITVSSSKADISLGKGSDVDSLLCNKKSAKVKVDVAKGSEIDIALSKKADLTITGNAKSNVNISASAKNSSVSTSVPVELDTKQNISLTLNAGSEGSTVNSTNKSSIKISNNSNETPTIKQDGKVISNNEPVSSGNSDVSAKPTISQKPTTTQNPSGTSVPASNGSTGDGTVIIIDSGSTGSNSGSTSGGSSAGSNGGSTGGNGSGGIQQDPSPVPAPQPTGTTDSQVTPTGTADPIEITPTGTTSTSTIPAETTPAETTPAETTPAETTPAETTPAETTPAETTPAETTPAETTPAETTPAETTPAETTPAETTPAETTPAETTPAETTPAETTPAETTPAATYTPADATLSVLVTYDQEEARTMLPSINAFRASEGKYEDSQLALTYDYNLEKAAMQRAAEIAIKFDGVDHIRPDGGEFKKTLEEYGFDVEERGDYIYGEDIIFADNNNLTLDQAFNKFTTDAGMKKIVLGFFTSIGIGHVKVDDLDFWVLLFSDYPNKTKNLQPVPQPAKGEIYVPINVPLDSITSILPGLVSGETTVAVGDTISIPKCIAKAVIRGSETDSIGISSVEANEGDEVLTFDSSNEFVKIENGNIKGVKAGTGKIYATYLGKTVELTINVTASARVQQLIDNAEVLSNTNLNVPDSSIIHNSDDILKFIYDGVKGNYSYNCLTVESLEMLMPESYYLSFFPSLETLTFTEPTRCSNTDYVYCNYTYKETSFVEEERAVDYALYNSDTSFLSSSETDLYNKVTSVASSLKESDTYKTVKNIHDYIVSQIAYTSQSQSGINDQLLRSALFNNMCVCAGYAKSFYFLCRACGVDVIYVTGTADDTNGQGGSHAWNKVEITNKWYSVDCTFDDPIPDQPGNVRYEYFLITDADMSIDHHWDNTGLPEAVSTDLGSRYSN